jgi:hypothetical protein
MSTAILVLGCYHPKSLGAALDYYQSVGASVYIHLDARRDLSAYKTFLPGNPEFTEIRHSIYWGGFNMVRAEVELIKLALASPKNHERFILVSDDTLPIVTPERFQELNSEPYERAWMINKTAGEDYSQRYREFYFWDSLATCPRVENIGNSFFDEAALAKIEQLQRLKTRGKSPIVPYHGSQWWSMSRAATQFVLNTHDCDLHLRESFEFSAVPDEMFVHSILGNGGYLDQMRNSPIHVDWHNRRPRMYANATDLPHTVDDDVAFIRKIDSESPHLLEFFRSKWLSGEPVCSTKQLTRHPS